MPKPNPDDETASDSRPDHDPNPITISNISYDEVTTSPPGLREAQSATFWDQPVNVIIASLDVNHSALGVHGVFDSWCRLHARYTNDLTFRQCLSITERNVVVAKLEEDIERLDYALTVYMSEGAGEREYKRGPERNVWDFWIKPRREGHAPGGWRDGLEQK